MKDLVLHKMQGSPVEHWLTYKLVYCKYCTWILILFYVFYSVIRKWFWGWWKTMSPIINKYILLTVVILLWWLLEIGEFVSTSSSYMLSLVIIIWSPVHVYLTKWWFVSHSETTAFTIWVTRVNYSNKKSKWQIILVKVHSSGVTHLPDPLCIFCC